MNFQKEWEDHQREEEVRRWQAQVKPFVGLALVALLLLAVFVWPSRYRYERLRVAGGSETVVRIDRLTGTSEYFDPGEGWVDPSKPSFEDLGFVPDKGPNARSYTDDELRKIAGVDEQGKPLKK